MIVFRPFCISKSQNTFQAKNKWLAFQCFSRRSAFVKRLVFPGMERGAPLDTHLGDMKIRPRITNIGALVFLYFVQRRLLARIKLRLQPYFGFLFKVLIESGKNIGIKLSWLHTKHGIQSFLG